MNIKRFGQGIQILNGGLDYVGGLSGDSILIGSGEQVNDITSSFLSPGDNSTLATTNAIVNYVSSTVGSSAYGDEGTIQFANSFGGFTGDTADLFFNTGNSTLEINSLSVTNEATFNGLVNINSGLDATGQNITGDTAYLSSLETTNNANIGADLNVTGSIIANSGVDATGQGITGDTINLSTELVLANTNITGIDEDNITNDNNNTLATTSAITSYVNSEISNISQTISGLDDTDVSSPLENQVLQWNGTDWENRSNLTVDGDANITGNLYITGTTTTVNSEDLNVSNRFILLNSGETGSGISAGTKSGVEVERGTLTNYQFIFDENDDVFKVGEIGDLQTVATRQDVPENSGVSYWNESENRMDTNTNFTYDPSNNELSISNSTFGDNVVINNNLTFGSQLLTGITTTNFTGSDYEIATTSAIVSFVDNQTSNYISGVTFNGDTGSEFLTELDIIGGTNIDTSLSSGILTVDFTGSYFKDIEGDSGSYSATSTAETLTFVGYSGITTEISGNEVRIINDESNTYTTNSISDGSTGKTITIGTQGEDGSAIVNYYLTNSSGNQEGQIRVLLNGFSSGATRDFQGDNIDAFDESDILYEDNGDISIKITNNSGSAVQMSYTIQTVEAH